MKELLAIVIPCLAILIFFYNIDKLIKRENNKAVEDNCNSVFIIHLSKMYIWIGLISSVLFISLFTYVTILFPRDIIKLAFQLFCIGLVVVGIILIVAPFKWKLEVYPDYFIYQNLFGKNFRFNYSDIKFIKLTQYSLKLKTLNKVISVDFNVIGFEVLYERLKEHKIIV
ncbi:MAG: DUF6560 family protein [Eubacteriaceae bacterium]